MVAAGRSNLDAVRTWVLDAAASVPQNASGEKMLTPIVQKGIGDVVEVVKTSNSQLNIIGASIRGLSEEYRALGDQKLGRTDPHADGTGKDGDKPEEPQNPYEKALRDAGLLKEPPTGYYKEWLDNAAKRNVPPEEIVKIAKETPYSAAEVQRIADRQEANSWSYDEDVNSVHEHGGRLMTTPNGMLMGLGGDQWQDVLSEGGGSTWGDIFMMNIDDFMMNIDDPADPAQSLRDVAASGLMWYPQPGGEGAPGILDLDRVLHHEERHSQQWQGRGYLGFIDAYATGKLVEIFTDHPLEKDAGLSDGGYE